MGSLPTLTLDRRLRTAARLLATLVLLLAPVSLASAVETRNFDHLTTGFELLGQHRYVPCEACHANAIFKGTPTACGACHGIGTAVRATAKPATHILSTDQCQACHTPWSWNPAVNFDHTQALGSCSTCHNGVQAQGKGPTHIVTDLECDACHTTLSWAGAVFSHAGVTSGCATCHNNVNAQGMVATHFPINDTGGSPTPCESCHSPTNYIAWGPGTLINHAAVTAMQCATCHETAAFLGMVPSTNTAAGDSRPNATLDSKHPTTGDCSQCHTTVSFAASVSRPANHIPTNANCTQCHTTSNDAQYSVTGTHQGVTGCLSCHGPTVNTTFANITIVTTPATHMPIGSLDCNGSGCHTTTNVNPGGFLIGPASFSSPTLTVAGHATVASAVPACSTCHETSPYVGMIASTAAAWGDSRPTAYDALHPTTGDCVTCHSTTPTFVTNLLATAPKPANHIPTNAVCTTCHTTTGNYAAYSSPATHQGVTSCLACHGPTVAGTFTLTTPAFSIVTTSSSHIPIGSLDCNGSGCHTAANVTPGGGGFKIGTASISSPTLTVAGHTTVQPVGACATCHETAPYQGMTPSTALPGGDSRPTAYDAAHPTTGDCGNCHVTTPTFASNLLPTAPKPANHMPTTAVCAQCHTTVGNFGVYDVTGVHQGVTTCNACHGPSTGPFAGPPPSNTMTIVGWPGTSHFPIGTADCGNSGCHTTTNVNPGGFKIGAANTSSPTLNVTGHATIASAGVAGCQTCHETAPYTGMIVGTAATWGDSRPTAYDANHPTTGDCNGCHTTTPTFVTDQTGTAKPANHIPTTAACAQCHTTVGNNAVYSVTGVHTGVTGCLTCHGPTVAGTFTLTSPAFSIVTSPSTHMPIGSLDCNGSGCHTTSNVNPGGFKIGAASVSAPTLTVAGHTTVAAAVSGCQTCHETAPYIGMVAGSSTTAGDSRPSTSLDANHPTTGDCNGCHSTTPTFTSNVTGGSKPTNHIPTSAACTQCHTTTGNDALYVMGTTGHTGITNNCAQCHAYGLSFYNMAPPTLVQPPSGATGHIPSNPPNGTGTIACELCHSATVFTQPGGFSGTVMKHATVTTMACDSCHEFGMTWKTNTGVQLWTRPGTGHHKGQDCGGSGCHTSRDKMAFRPVTAIVKTPTTATATTAKASTATASGPAPRPGATSGTGLVAPAAGAATLASAPGTAPSAPFNHATVAGQPCLTCHNGTAATGKPASHITTTNSCQSCHTTLAWLPVKTVDHSQVIGSCVSCHNGTTATGKPSNHIPTTAGCDSCHTTNAWVPARFDHAGVAPHTCNTCHNGVQAIGMPSTHIATTASCDTCHGTLAWKPALIDHSTFVGNCARCHNNIAAAGTPPSHFVTHLDCASCHSYPDWSVIRFHHLLTAAYPGDHSVAITCAQCHTTNAEQVPYAAPAYAGTCAGCHAKNYVATAHPKTLKGQLYTVGELANCTGACHVYSDASLTTIARSQPGPRHRVTDAAFK